MVPTNSNNNRNTNNNNNTANKTHHTSSTTMGEGQEINTKRNTFHLSEFKTIRKLGSGRFGKVVLASTKIDHHFQNVIRRDDVYLYAIKILNNNKFDKVIYNLSNANYINKINNEIKIMNYLNKFNHPNILVLYSIINNEISNLKINKFYFIMEYCELGELTLNNFSKLPYESKYPMFNIQHKIKDIIKGLEFLHLNQIVHRDIKPSNFLIDSRGTVKISDLGTCFKLTGNMKDDLSELKNPVGTPLFFPPEICCNGNTTTLESKSSSSSFHLTKPRLFQSKRKPIDLGYEIDIWSLGITFYYLFFGSFPFHNENEFRLFNDIVANPIRFPSNASECYLLRKVLNEPSNALNADYNLKLAKYFTHLCDLLKKMLIKDPETRIDMKGLKNHKLLGLFSKDKNDNFNKFNDEFLKKFNGSQNIGQTRSMVRHSQSNNLLNSYQEPVNSNVDDDAIRMKGTFAKIFASKSHQSSHTDSSTTNVTNSDLDEDTSFASSYEDSNITAGSSININHNNNNNNNKSHRLNKEAPTYPTMIGEMASPSLLHLINDSSISLPNLNNNISNPYKQTHDSHKHRVNDSPQLNINIKTREKKTTNRPFDYTKSFINELGSHFDNVNTSTTTSHPHSRNPSSNSKRGDENQRDSLNTINTLPSKLSDTLAPTLFQQREFESSRNSLSDYSNNNSPISERFLNLSLSVSKDSSGSGSKLVRSQATKGSLSKLKSSKRINFQKVLDVDGDHDLIHDEHDQKQRKHKTTITMDQYLDSL